MYEVVEKGNRLEMCDIYLTDSVNIITSFTLIESRSSAFGSGEPPV